MNETEVKRGRPRKVLAQEIKDHICEQLAEGRSLRAICRDDNGIVGCTEGNIRRILVNDTKFYTQYAHARDIGLDTIVDEIMDIADDGTNDYMEKEGKNGNTYIALDSEHVQRSKLRVDARKWFVSKLAPKRYGDRIQQEISNPDGSLKNADTGQVMAKLNGILAGARQRKADAEQPKEDESIDDFI